MNGTSCGTQKRVMAGKRWISWNPGEGLVFILVRLHRPETVRLVSVSDPTVFLDAEILGLVHLRMGCIIRHIWDTACPKKPFLEQWSPKGSRYLYAQKTIQISYMLRSLHLIEIIFLFQFDCLTLSIYLSVPSGPLEVSSLVIFTLNYSCVINGIRSTVFSENKRWVFRWLPSLILIGFWSNLRHM